MKKTQKEWINYLHWGIGILIMVLGYVIPASEPLTPMGVKILMIFAGMIYLWCTVNPIGGSLLALLAVSLVGYDTFSGVLSSAISNSTWLITFYACILFMSSIESGMPQYISHGIFKATQNFITGRPIVLIFIIMSSAFIVSALTEIIPTVLMFWAICYAIIDDLKLEKSDRYSMFLILSSFMGAMLGNAALPFKGATIIIISAFEKASGMPVPYGPFIIINLFCSLIIMLLYCAIVKYVFRLDLSNAKNIDGKILASNKLAPMSISVKAHLFAVLAFIILVLINSFLPESSPFKALLTSWGTEGIAVVLIIFLFIVKDSGKPCMNIKKTMESMPWSAIFMVMSAVFMAGAMKNAEITGIIPWLKTVLNPILGGHSEFVFAALVFALAMILTCFFHNGALGNMMMPILFAIADTNGYHGVAIAAMMTLAINVAFLAPSASNYAPLLHSNKAYISLKDIWTYGLFFELLTFAIFLFVGLPIAKIMM